MESKKQKRELNLLPVYFKKIGLAVMILSFATAVIIVAINITLTQFQKELLQVFSLNGFLLGLLIIAVSKDKVEDELTIAIRLRSMAFSFITAVVFVIIKPVIDLFFYTGIQHLPARELIMSMLFVYLLMYYWQKLAR